LAFSWGKHLYLVRVFPAKQGDSKKPIQRQPEVPLSVLEELNIQVVATTVLRFSAIAIQWLTRDVPSLPFVSHFCAG